MSFGTFRDTRVGLFPQVLIFPACGGTGILRSVPYCTVVFRTGTGMILSFFLSN